MQPRGNFTQCHEICVMYKNYLCRDRLIICIFVKKNEYKVKNNIIIKYKNIRGQSKVRTVYLLFPVSTRDVFSTYFVYAVKYKFICTQKLVSGALMDLKL